MGVSSCAQGLPRKLPFKALSSGPAPTYKRIRLRNTWIGGQRALIQNTQPVFSCNPSVLLAEESPRTLSLPCLLASAKRKGIGTLLWGHFSSNRRALSKVHPLDRYRIALAKRVDGCVCYTDQIAELIAPHIPGERCFVARNTLDTPQLFKLYSALEEEGKAHIRNRLGLPERGRIVVFVGRLVADKRPEILLNLHKALGITEQTALVVIGDGPEYAKLLARVENEGLENVFLPRCNPAPRRFCPIDICGRCDGLPWICRSECQSFILPGRPRRNLHKPRSEDPLPQPGNRLPAT